MWCISIVQSCVCPVCQGGGDCNQSWTPSGPVCIMGCITIVQSWLCPVCLGGGVTLSTLTRAFNLHTHVHVLNIHLGPWPDGGWKPRAGHSSFFSRHNVTRGPALSYLIAGTTGQDCPFSGVNTRAADHSPASWLIIIPPVQPFPDDKEKGGVPSSGPCTVGPSPASICKA